MKTNWKESYKKILKAEGGFVNDKDDRGGMTIFGLTRKNYPVLFLWDKVDEMLKNGKIPDRDLLLKDPYGIEVESTYKTCFWKACKCDNLPDKLDYCVFSCAVNCGTGRAAKILQGVVGATQDGIIGNKTIELVNKFEVSDLLERFAQAWKYYYKKIVDNNPSQKKFYRGWINRVNEIMG